jgi:hypothetical protein
LQIKRIPQRQRIRVVTQGVHFYTTAREIREGVGDEYHTNASIQKALDALEYGRSRASNPEEQRATGIAGRWENRDVQLDIL